MLNDPKTRLHRPVDVMITRPEGGDRAPDEAVQLSVKDAHSHRVALRLSMSLEALGSLVSKSTPIPCRAHVMPGMFAVRREYKVEEVAIPSGSDRAEVRRLVAAYELNGWKGRDADAVNLHRRNADAGTQRVGFERFVPEVCPGCGGPTESDGDGVDCTDATCGLPIVGAGAKSASEDALDAIAVLCGCPEWDYPGQVARDVHEALTRRPRLTGEQWGVIRRALAAYSKSGVDEAEDARYLESLAGRQEDRDAS